MRILTYNVHGCRGTDGVISPERIAKVISQYEPDVVALQELDLSRQRSEEMDQPHLIAKQLGMMYHFHAALQVEEEQYGNAVLSRYPLKLVKASALPSIPGFRKTEPRGAIWVEAQVNGRSLQLVNTHLGLSAKERMVHTNALLGEDWLGNHLRGHPVVLCGDFNAWALSAVCRRVRKNFLDVQMTKSNHKPKATWISHLPFSRIDHIFVSDGMEIENVEVPTSKLNRRASDHLPLLADLGVPAQL